MRMARPHGTLKTRRDAPPPDKAANKPMPQPRPVPVAPLVKQAVAGAPLLSVPGALPANTKEMVQ